MPRPSLACLVVAALALSQTGCKLVDQTTFGAKPEPPAPDLLSEALAEGSRIPLVVIRYDSTPEMFDDALNNAAEMALDRKPDATFDVVTVVPGTGSANDQSKAMEAGTSDLTDVMGQLANDGVDPERIHLSARTDPAISAHEIRVYVH
jgi:hypothetical protein